MIFPWITHKESFHILFKALPLQVFSPNSLLVVNIFLIVFILILVYSVFMRYIYIFNIKSWMDDAIIAAAAEGHGLWMGFRNFNFHCW